MISGEPPISGPSCPRQIGCSGCSVWLAHFSGSWRRAFVLERVESAAVEPGHNIGRRLDKCGQEVHQSSRMEEPRCCVISPGTHSRLLALTGGKGRSGSQHRGWRPAARRRTTGRQHCKDCQTGQGHAWRKDAKAGEKRVDKSVVLSFARPAIFQELPFCAKRP